MQRIFEAQTYPTTADYSSEVEAREAVEKHGSGYVVTYIRGFDGRDRSCAMNVWKDGAWHGVDISR